MRTRLALPATLLAALVLAASVPPSPAAVEEHQDQTKPAPIYDETADAKADIAAALSRAKQENRRVLIQWGANWCGWCRLLHELMKKDGAIARKLSYEYDVVRVDVGRFDKNQELAASYGADLKKHGVPFLTVLAADGKALANQETGSLELKDPNQKGHDPKQVLAFLTEHQAPYLEARKVYDAGLAQAKKDGKRLFLHFGAPW